MAKENRKHKDSIFTDLFYSDVSAKENLLELHNALYNTKYSDPEVINLIGLEDVLFQNFKNDVAFSVDGRRIVLSEHQSTVNPNMPVRDLLYIAREYEKVIPVRNRYKTTLVPIPTPQFLVFYNGARDQPVEQILKLSDAFIEPEEGLNLELIVRVININPDKHHEMLEKCNVLREYSLFVEETRRYSKDEHQLERAVNECIKKGILAEYLSRKSSEVINMLMAEYSYETEMEVLREEAREEAEKEAARKADKRIREAEEKAEEKVRKAGEKLAVIVENAAKNFGISVEEACGKMGITYEEYLEMRKNPDI